MTIISDPLSECWGVVRGDYRSPNGANRLGDCKHPPRFKVTMIDAKPGARYPVTAFCGIHVRAFQKHPTLYMVEALA